MWQWYTVKASNTNKDRLILKQSNTTYLKVDTLDFRQNVKQFCLEEKMENFCQKFAQFTEVDTKLDGLIKLEVKRLFMAKSIGVDTI